MLSTAAVRRELKGEPDWPATNGRRAIFLADASSPLELALIREWIARRRPEGADPSGDELIRIPPTRRRNRRASLKPLEETLVGGGDALLAPIRVVWLARKRDGVRQVRLSDILRFGDPRDPDRLHQWWIASRERDRCRIVAGEPAPASELRARWREAGGADIEATTGLAEFVSRQAALALERAERRLRGARYKVPRLVHEDILGRPAFRGGLRSEERRVGKECGS
jgi:glycerol-3-phosphate O-acyltransferase